MMYERALPTPVSPFPHGRPVVAEKMRLHLFDYLMIFVTMVIIASSSHWKVQGPVILICFVGFCVSYVIYGAVVRGIVLRNGLLVLWTVVGILHVLLSWLEWLPGDRVFFMREYVLRMGYFTFTMLPVTAALYGMFVVVHYNNATRKLAYLGIISAVCAALAFYFFPPVDGHWIVEGEDLSLLGVMMSVLNYTIGNIGVLLWWSVFYLIRNSWRWMLPVFVVLAISDSAQMNMVALLLFGLWIVRNPLRWAKPIAAVIIFGLPFSAVLLVAFAENLGIDPNTIHRANWWVEAFSAVLRNGGIALGFGADSTRDYVVDDRFDMLGKWGQLPIHVIHNDFVYSFYSMGFIGGIMFLILHFKYLAPRRAPNIGVARVGVITFLIACLTTSVNSALVSPALLIGLCWIYGYCLFLNQSTASRKS